MYDYLTSDEKPQEVPIRKKFVKTNVSQKLKLQTVKLMARETFLQKRYLLRMRNLLDTANRCLESTKKMNSFF